MKTHIVHWSNFSTEPKSSLWYQQLCRRHVEFNQELNWDLPHMIGDTLVPDGIKGTPEADAYDRFDTYYVLVADDANQCIGNARLLRTDRKFKVGSTEYSYMLRDATRGLLPTMPPELSEIAPVSDEIWEMSRFQADNNKITIEIFRAAKEFLLSNGCKATVAFSRAGFVGFLSKMGLPSKQVGPTIKYGNKPYAAIYTELLST